MVVLAAAVTTRSGRPIVSRQFISMQKSRIEGLLASFPKLMTSGKQHTFVETDSVRFVYQPLDQLYVVLVTTRTSNILEDLETLSLFSRVVSEFCRALTERAVFDAAFSLIFAFDEIVTMGYRESVTLAQVCTYVEMDSHEEKVYQAVRQTQERDAKQKMREKAKELQRQKYDTQKRGAGSGGGSGLSAGSAAVFIVPSPGGFGGGESRHQMSLGSVAGGAGAGGGGGGGGVQQVTIRAAGSSSKALKLGKKSRDVDSFVDQLQSEGQKVASVQAGKSAASSSDGHGAAPVSSAPVQLSIVEQLQLVAHRSGRLEQLQLEGQATLRCRDPQLACLQLHVVNTDAQLQQLLQLQTNPQLDKLAFQSDGLLRQKKCDRPFPLDTDVKLLRWRLQTKDERLVPLTLNCWPSENANSGCDVNIEYTLENKALSLSDLTIAVPIVRGMGEPVVGECEGSCEMNSRLSQLVWSVPLVDADNSSGTLEFSCGGRPSDFFPVSVGFTCSDQTLAGVSVDAVLNLADSQPVPFTVTSALQPDKYEII